MTARQKQRKTRREPERIFRESAEALPPGGVPSDLIHQARQKAQFRLPDVAGQDWLGCRSPNMVFSVA